MKSFYIETYGCQMNVYDSEMVAQHLINNGFKKAETIEEADYLIFNTCSVRQHAEDRVLGRITNEFGRKKNNPGMKIGVIGCMAQRLGDKLLDKDHKVDFVLGVDQYHKIPELLGVNSEDVVSFTEMNDEENYETLYPEETRENPFNAFITIMRGCNNFCTYCIVPYVRGRERSRSVDEIMSEIENAVKHGFREITLLGQNVNSYQSGDVNFAKLLTKICTIEELKRVRFVTSHPKDLSDEVIGVMAKEEKICKHLHLPMQSGSTEILKKMNRGYTREHYLEIIKKLRTAMPEIGLTTDVIVGFPGETEEQYQETIDIMKKIEFDFAFMFKYSPREGTKAAKFENQVPEEIRLKRLSQLIDIQNQITTKKYVEEIGKIKEIYVEKVSKKNDEELAGKADNFKITVFKGDKSLIGKFVKVKITEATGWTLKGELIESIN